MSVVTGSRRIPIRWRLLAAGAAAAAAVGAGAGDPPASAPADEAPGIVAPAANPFGRGPARTGRRDALPGVVCLSDGTVIPGQVYTTRDKDWQVWVDAEKRWRHVPPILVLSIRAVVVEERMDKEWRWKEMGSDEKVYTGRTRPVRRHRWRFHLIDDSWITGTVKGQPLWIRHAGRTRGPFVLHERSAGKYGQDLDDLVYVRKVVISRRAMADALDDRAPTTRSVSRDTWDSGD